ncbi:MAG: hypothetical protein II600_07295, partial [Bacteroidaceae bacterium]|nr:hypothetical protein [Bacteroidaceae bacterium]
MKKRILLVLFSVAAVALVGVGVLSAMLLQHRVVLPSATTEEGACIYIDADDDVDSVRAKSALGWRFDWYARLMD